MLTDFPFLNTKSLEFGLYRTYAIPRISKLLVHTGNLAQMTTVGRRYDDTDFVIREIVERGGFTPDQIKKANGDSELLRAKRAIERLNSLHGRWNIPNDDFLYVLSVFICEPIRWIERYGFRRLDKKEKRAHFHIWTQIGIAMNMHSIPATLEEMMIFNTEFEEKYMIHAKTNAIVSDATSKLFFTGIPQFLHPLGMQIVSALCDTRLRRAMNLQDPKIPFLTPILHAALTLSALTQRYLLLPRSRPSRRTAEKVDPITGTYIGSWVTYVDSYPNGYKIEQLGPERYMNDGKKVDIGKVNEKSFAPIGTYVKA